jgi:hypothetical protein
MNQITLQTIKPVVVEMLQNLAQENQRTLEEEINSILENAVLVERTVDLTAEDQKGATKNTFWKKLQEFRLTIENEGINFTDEDFADLRDRSQFSGIIFTGRC